MSESSTQDEKTPAVKTGQRLRGPGAPNWNGGKPAPQFPKGVSGNPGGRPSDKPITEAYNRILSMRRLELASWQPKTGAEKLAFAMIKRAWDKADKLGVSAAKEVTDRVEGTPDRTLRLTDPTGKHPPRVRLEFTARGPQTVVELEPALDRLVAGPGDDEDDEGNGADDLDDLDTDPSS